MLLSMHARTPAAFALLAAAALAQPWSTKPPSQWNEDDARQVLSASPWVRKTRVAIIPIRGEAQMREGGKMGQQNARPLDAVSRDVMIRWESAPAVRTAELLAHESGAPDWDGDYYVVAVYDLSGVSYSDLKALASELKTTALLKREGKKDIKPSRVDIVPSDHQRVRVVYLFPRTAPISIDDSRIVFVAQIGRLSLTQQFPTADMLLQGKLEL